MPGCIIRGCASRRVQPPESVLHAFPRNGQRIRSWLEQTGHRFKNMDSFIARILEAKKSDGYGICSAHFTPDCYVTSGEGRVLRAEAVPTIFPPGDKLISEVIQLRVSRKARQARLQHSPKPADCVSGLDGVGSANPAAVLAKMEAETQTEDDHPAEPAGELWGTRIKEEPPDVPPLPSTPAKHVKYDPDPSRNVPDGVRRSDHDHQSRISDQLLQLTLQIIYLLTGEDYGPIKKESGDRVTRRSTMESLPPSRTPEKDNEQKILEITNTIIELLTGEVPVRDVAMEKQEFKGHYKEAMIEDQTSDVSENSARFLRTSGKKKGRLSSKPKEGHGPPPKSPGNTHAEPHDTSTLDCHMQSTSASEQSSSSEEQHQLLLVNPRRKCHQRSSSRSSSHVMEEHFPKPNLFTRTPPSQGIPIQEPPSSPEEHISMPNTDHSFAPAKQHFPSGEERLPHLDNPRPVHRRKRAPPIKKKVNEEHFIDEVDFKTSLEERAEDFMSCDEERFASPDISHGQGRPIPTGTDPSSSEEDRLKFSDHYMLSNEVQVDVLDLPTPNGEEEPLLSEDGLYTDTSTQKFPVEFSANGIYKRYLDHPEYFDRSLFCPECGKSFTDRARVEAHLRTHWGEKAYCCPMCPKTFRSHNRFVMHQIMHSGEKPFSCSECGKRFAQNSYLQRHMMGHTGEKPFPCSLCGKGFACKSDMIKHELTHTGARPHPCLVCNKRFTKKSHLNRHMRIHTGEKPFCCPDCGRNFGCNSDMVSHQRIHQGIKPFSCHECGKSFLRKQDAVRHQTIHRPMGEDMGTDPGEGN